MVGICRDFIEYIGISPKLPNLDQVAAFKQFEIQEFLTIPIAKPDVEQIVKVCVNAEVNCTNIISTPIAVSGEGQELTGKKVIVHGNLSQEIVYVANTPEQSVHAAHFNHCFSTFIVVPNSISLNTNLLVRPYIEDIYAQLTDLRSLTKSVMLLLTVSY